MTNQFFEWLKLGAIALGVVAALAAALFLFLAVRGRKAGKKSKAFNISASAVIALSLAVVLVANYFVNLYSYSIDAVMTVFPATTDQTDRDDWKQMAYTIAEEGMVLLENKDNALPLASGAKVNLLGYYAYNPVYSGSGSGSVSAADSYSITASLADAGITINPDIYASGIYGNVAAAPAEGDGNVPSGEATGEGEGGQASGKGEGGGGNIGFMGADFTLKEVPVDVYTGNLSFENMAAYSDTAIVVIGRSGAEGADLTAFEGEDYLDLQPEERDLLSAASKAFDKVIVVMDCANAVEMGFVDEYDIDAVIWAGVPGPYGFEALGKILTGEVNPSGKLPDTWVYDNDSAPANENFGENIAANDSTRFYVDYVEGIYVGYKWYETAYAEEAVVTHTKTGKTFDYSNYDSIVAYPFGYGLSYTTFTQEITGGTLTNGAALNATGNYTVEVTVTNTGDVAGKTPVQLYVTAPYTDYDKQNNVEKAAVSLLNFEKTELLQPGASAKVTIEVAMENVASYDSSHDNGDSSRGSYMLDAGEYIFSVRDGSHTELDAVSASLANQYFFSGDNKRSSDEVAAVNQYEDAARGEYLSRKDGFANYSSAMASVSTSVNDLTYTTTLNAYDPALDDVVTKTYTKGVDYEVAGNLTFADLQGADYDDPRWDELIAQMSLDELITLAGGTMYSSPAIASIAKEATTDSDGPLGISSMFSTDLVTVAFPCIPLLSATFNKDLAHQMGQCVGDQAEINHISAWYAPAMDTHRSAYSGRNFEYYSEDGTLAAYMAAEEVGGAREKGLLMYIKHFFLNDQETHRAYVHTYSNEQAMREIYLKPFEYSVKFGGATGVMNSMNYIGDVYVGAHVGTLENVLRGEWGFRGSVLTDMDEGKEIRNFWSTIRAGVDIWLGPSSDTPTVNNDADIYYLQRAAHNQLYFLANGNTYAAQVLNWQPYRTAIYAELIGLAICCAAALVIRNVKKKQQE